MSSRVSMMAGVLVSAALLFGAVAAQAFTLDIYETLQNTPTGTACEICSVLPLPTTVSGGYVIVLENALGSIANQSTWSDVLIFGTTAVDGILQGSSFATFAQLLSDGCASGTEGDRSCFPSAALVQTFSNAVIVETAPPTIYQAGDNIYRIFSDAPEAQVPQPMALVLLGFGLATVGALARRLAS
jgi:hypothetical protein